MKVQITITDVPKEIRDKLTMRAALQRLSLEEFLRREMERIVAPTDNAQLMKDIEKRLAGSQSRVTVEDVLNARDADRK